jgi:hypothetical protein
MTETEELSESDRELLNEVEAIVDKGNYRDFADDPMVGFCSLLASTQPQASQAFQQKLWEDLVSRKARRHSFLTLLTGLLQHIFRSVRSVHSQRSRALVIVGIALMIVLISAVFIPSVRSIASEFIKQIKLGNYSEVNQIETIYPSALTNINTPMNIWRIDTGIERIGGNLPDGVDSTVRIFSTIEEAQMQVSYRILQPNYLPYGYSLHEIKAPPKYPSAPESVFLFYSGPEKDIYFSSMPVGEGPVITNNIISVSLEEQQATVSQLITVIQIVTNGSLEETRVNDHIAAWIDGDLLAWYVDGFLYKVGGLDLTEAEAIKIAESIK